MSLYIRGGTRALTRAITIFVHWWSEVKTVLQKIASTRQCSNATTNEYASKKLISLHHYDKSAILWGHSFMVFHCELQ